MFKYLGSKLTKSNADAQKSLSSLFWVQRSCSGLNKQPLTIVTTPEVRPFSLLPRHKPSTIIHKITRVIRSTKGPYIHYCQYITFIMLNNMKQNKVNVDITPDITQDLGTILLCAMTLWCLLDENQHFEGTQCLYLLHLNPKRQQECFKLLVKVCKHTIMMLHNVWVMYFESGVSQLLEEKMSLCYIQKLRRYIYLKEFSKFTKRCIWREEHKSEY